MTRVTVLVDARHIYRGISLSGHAGSADRPQEKQDLVCAAVSALTLNMVNSVEQFTNDRYTAEEADGKFRFRFTGRISSGSRLLMNSLVFGLTNIAEEYGEPYINIRFKEV